MKHAYGSPRLCVSLGDGATMRFEHVVVPCLDLAAQVVQVDLRAGNKRQRRSLEGARVQLLHNRTELVDRLSVLYLFSIRIAHYIAGLIERRKPAIQAASVAPTPTIASGA